MNIVPKKGVLLVKKHKQTAYKSDMAIVEDENDKRLITCEVLSDGINYKKGDSIICGKYALYQLTIQGEDYFLLEEEDVIGTTNYKE